MELTISLQEARIELSVTLVRLLEAIRDAGVSVLIPLPKNAMLSLEYASGFSIRTVPPLSEVVDLSNVDYALVDSENVMEAVREPESLINLVSWVAKQDHHTGAISDIPISHLCQTAFGRVAFHGEGLDKHLVPEQSLSLMASGRVMSSSLGAISECLEYFPSYNELGSFTPSESTTQAIKDMNVAYQLFRIEKPLGAQDDSHRIVMTWLKSRWNTPERLPKKRGPQSPVGNDLLRKAADVILGGNVNIGIGDLRITDSVKARHHAGAPEALMMMEYLAQDRPPHPVKPDPDELDYRSHELLLDSLKEKGVAPSKYRDLLVRLLTMDTTHY